MSSLDVELIDVVKDFESGGRRVRAVDHVSVQIADGEFFALLGPSGCGKTTTLRLIAGFEQPTAGRVLIRGRAMQGIPAYHRPVNTVFQDYALFPHLTVEQNIMFGLQMEGVEKKDAQKRALESLEQVRLPGVGGRKPHQLSGGQQQRVALARALVKQPAVLLLDEPLGALDLKLRKNMQVELKALQRDVGITFIYVTHDQEEAITMADRIAVMSQGKMLQVGSPKEIYERPGTHFVADFIGETNFVDGALLEREQAGFGVVKLMNDAVIRARLSDTLSAAAGPVLVAIRPERISISRASAEPAGPGMTSLPAKLVDSQYIGTDTRFTLQIGEAGELVARVQNIDDPPKAAFSIGQAVTASWRETSATVLDR
ncbi:MAG: ABC transporter ATP-binding protein [Chloroflexi bacterium]|nr:ABC transporter ATP-binding protein [Chloroflexota bacterium]MCY4246696.1 ABC transporter ATP-binding protein [Chloroflexota bacterium]